MHPNRALSGGRRNGLGARGTFTTDCYTVIFMTGESRWVGEEDDRYPFLHVQGKASPAYEAMKHVRVDV